MWDLLSLACARRGGLSIRCNTFCKEYFSRNTPAKALSGTVVNQIFHKLNILIFLNRKLPMNAGPFLVICGILRIRPGSAYIGGTYCRAGHDLPLQMRLQDMAPRLGGSIHTTGTSGNDFHGFRGSHCPRFWRFRVRNPITATFMSPPTQIIKIYHNIY